MLKVGQKVICIESTPSGSVKEGEIYTISGVYDNQTGVRLVEAEPVTGCFAFHSWRFCPWEHSWADEILSKLMQELETESSI